VVVSNAPESRAAERRFVCVDDRAEHDVAANQFAKRLGDHPHRTSISRIEFVQTGASLHSGSESVVQLN
jgi:hypothetical protein